jgi:hypothetical protein
MKRSVFRICKALGVALFTVSITYLSLIILPTGEGSMIYFEVLKPMALYITIGVVGGIGLILIYVMSYMEKRCE